MIKLFQPYVNQEAKDNVIRVLGSGMIAQGPEVDMFEAEFAEDFGFEPWQIVSLNSGTSALELAYELCEILEGDRVIAPILTCTATNIPLVRRSAKIIFADIEGKKNLNIDPEDVSNKIDEDTKAVVFVHFGGSSEGLSEVEEICGEFGVDLICDAAQALGSKLSRSARFSCVSLQAIKSLTAGDGGILICRDKEDADLARKLRWFGYDRPLKQKLGDCDLELAGYKYHMNDINAAIARGNLVDWEKIQAHRNDINDIYAEASGGKGFIRGIWNPCVVGMHFDTWRGRCQEAGFEIGQYHYPNDKYSIFRGAEAMCPVMHNIQSHYFMLPCHMGMTLQDAELIAKTIWPVQ